MARPTSPNSKKPAKKPATPRGAAAAGGLHYSKTALLKDYHRTFNLFMKALVFGVGGVLVYFLIFAVYLGGWSHTPTTDYAARFNDRYPIDYAGTKLPEYGGPAAPEPAGH